MRDSKVGSLKHTHLIGCEDLRSENYKGFVQDKLKGNSYVIREVPIHRMYRGAESANASIDLPGFSRGKNFSAGKNLTDFDTPELVVFLQEDPEQFAKNICIEREVSTKGKCQIKDCMLENNRLSCLFDPDMESNSELNEGTTETLSSNSNGSESASRHPCIRESIKKYGFTNLMVEGEDSGNEGSTDHPTENTTSKTLKEDINEEADFSRSFNNWKIDSLINTIGSRMEFPHCANCQQFLETSSLSRPGTGNSQSIAGSGRSLDREEDHGESSSSAVGPLSGPESYTGPPTKSGIAPHQYSDSISSAHSFTFPILVPEWNGSPVRMEEADREQSRSKQAWRKIFSLCCKFCRC